MEGAPPVDKMTSFSTAALNRSHPGDAPVADARAPGLRPLARPDPALRRRAILTQAVQQEVIPHLLGQHAPVRDPAPHTRDVTEAQVAHLAELALQPSSLAAVAFVTAMLDEGFAADTLYLDLLTPAAALLGQYWADDICNFADVTIGLIRLQQAMRALGPAFFGAHTLPSPTGPRALLLPLPGEQHTFGLVMLSDFFHRAGWNIWTGVVADTAELRAMVDAEWVDMVGFSLACNEGLDTARREIAAVRQASRNPALVVMVGGPPFARDPRGAPSLAAAVGADGTACDGSQAVVTAHQLLPRRVKRR